MDQCAPDVSRAPAAATDLHFWLVEALYTEAMVLADEARAYFEAATNPERAEMNPLLRVSFSCESLKTTTRLMQVIAWLLCQRAVQAAELTAAQAAGQDRLMGDALASDPDLCAQFPDAARLIIAASEMLYDRVLRLQRSRIRLAHKPPASPARDMLAHLHSLY